MAKAKFVGQFTSRKLNLQWHIDMQPGEKYESFRYVICMCGHAAAKHSISESSKFCMQNNCPCSEFYPVLATETLKPFRFLGRAADGFKSALGKGVNELSKTGGRFIQLQDMNCAICHVYSDYIDVAFFPEPLNHPYEYWSRRKGTYKFLCAACFHAKQAARW